MRDAPIIVIGAGAAGLAAVEMLARAGRRVTLLEGRSRIGGRIHTVLAQGGKVPIELGAEFVHGEKVCTWEIIRAAKLRTHRMPDRHWRFAQGKLAEVRGFYQELDQVIGKINAASPDEDLQSFLNQAEGLSDSAKRLATDYVEGFHAAPAGRMSTHWLARAEQAEQEDTGQFRLAKGYAALLQRFGERLQACRAEIRLNTVVKTVRWNRGQVEILTRTQGGPQTFCAPQAVVTLPLGVLQAQGPEGVVFEPELGEKEKAIQGLAMGTVVKLTLQFSSRFWPIENFGLIHAEESALFTWWADERGLVLIGWAGGPRAERLCRAGRDAVVSEAVHDLAQFFHVEPAQVQGLLVASFMHDWLNDPFARGAYSYPPVGMGDMPKLLAAPLSDTLFFAGEATDPGGDLGTVHGALASGRRAAEQVLAVGAAERG